MAMHKSNGRIEKATQPYLFQNGSILTDLPVDDLRLIEANIFTETRKRGDVLFKQGAFPKGAYWLKTGKIKIFQGTTDGDRQTHYIYSDGDLIGYRQLIAEEANPVSAILLEDSTVSMIPADVFRGLISSSPFFARNVLSALAREFAVWMNRMTVFTKFPVRRRLLLALLMLHEQYRLSGSPKGEITMTRTELAEYVGASLETVVRVLNTFKSENLVQVSGRRILISDAEKLLDMLQEEV